MLNVIDERSPGDLFYARGDWGLTWRERNSRNKITRDCPGMVAGWKQKIAWCREEVRLTYQLQDVGLDVCQVIACLSQAKVIFYGDSDPDGQATTPAQVHDLRNELGGKNEDRV